MSPNVEPVSRAAAESLILDGWALAGVALIWPCLRNDFLSFNSTLVSFTLFEAISASVLFKTDSTHCSTLARVKVLPDPCTIAESGDSLSNSKPGRRTIDVGPPIAMIESLSFNHKGGSGSCVYG